MTYERWMNLYQEAMDILKILDNSNPFSCPFIKDDSVSCNCCKIQNECKYVVGMRILRPK